MAIEVSEKIDRQTDRQTDLTRNIWQHLFSFFLKENFNGEWKTKKTKMRGWTWCRYTWMMFLIFLPISLLVCSQVSFSLSFSFLLFSRLSLFYFILFFFLLMYLFKSLSFCCTFLFPSSHSLFLLSFYLSCFVDLFRGSAFWQIIYHDVKRNATVFSLLWNAIKRTWNGD
jgi:hypothetical protein